MKKSYLVIEAILILAGLVLTCYLTFAQSGPGPNEGTGASAQQEGMKEGPAEGKVGNPQEKPDMENGPASPEEANPGGWVGKVMPYVTILMYLLVAYYVFAGYKKPHGDLLRYVMFAFAFGIALRDAVSFIKGTEEFQILPFLAMFIAYISGRLNKIEKNRVLLILVSLILVAKTVYEIFRGPVSDWGYYVPLCIQWAVIVNAYLGRYKEHKEAGLLDGSDVKQ